MEETNSSLYLCIRAADCNKDCAAPLPSTHQLLTVCDLKNVYPTLIYIGMHQKNIGGFLHFNSSGRLPALICRNEEFHEVIDGSEEIIQYLDEKFPDPPLMSHSKSALNIQRQMLFTHFCTLMKNPNMEQKAKNSLLEKLEWLDIWLKEKQTRFLDGDDLKLPDTAVLPLLHLIQIAGRVKNLEIPKKFERVWEYIQAAESIPAFTKNIPPDDLIFKHWCTH